MRNLRLAIAAMALVALACCSGPSTSPVAPSPSAATGVPATTTTRNTVTRLNVYGADQLQVGLPTGFLAEAVFSDGSRQYVHYYATWLSSDESVATVSPSGVVTGRMIGGVSVGATYQGVQGSRTVTVIPAQTFMLSGTVTDVDSGAPLSATVNVIDSRAGTTRRGVTDAFGRYSIRGFYFGALLNATVTAPNYVAITAMLVPPSAGDMTHDFVLQRAAPGGAITIGFDGAVNTGERFDTYNVSGVSVTATTTNWTVVGAGSTGWPYPNQPAYIQFSSPVNTTTVAEVKVTAAGGRFALQSVDVSSSMTPVPYVITGTLNSAPVFTLSDTQGNTFGNFVTVVNPRSDVRVDTLFIRVTNPGVSCCAANAMALDNIVLRTAGW